MSKKDIKLTPQSQAGEYGYVDENDNWVIAPQFKNAWKFENGIAMVQKGRLYGFIKPDGSWLFEPQFGDALGFTGIGIARVKKNGKIGFIKNDGSWLFEPQFEDELNYDRFYSPDVNVRVKKGGKYGYIKPDGTFLFEPQFDKAYEFSLSEECEFSEVKLSDKYGVVSIEGSYLLEPIYEDIRLDTGLSKDGNSWFAIVVLNGKAGIIKNGQTLLTEIIFDEIAKFKNQISLVRLNGKFGFIHANGNYIIAPEFEEISGYGDYNDELYLDADTILRVKKDGKWGWLKSDGTYLIEPKFEEAERFERTAANVKLADKWGYIDLTGKWLIEPKYDTAFILKPSQGENGKWGYKMYKDTGSYFNRYVETDVWEIEPKFDNAEPFNKNVAVVNQKGKFGVIRLDGSFLLESIYDKIENTMNIDLIIVVKDNKYSLYDRSGNQLYKDDLTSISYNYDYERKKIKDNVILIEHDGKYGILRSDGHVLIEPIYDEINFSRAWSSYDKDGSVKVRLGDKWGFADLEFITFVEPIYDEISFFRNGVAQIKLEGKYGYIGLDGSVIVEPIYNNVAKSSSDIYFVQNGDKIGYIKEDGSVLIDPVCDWLSYFINGIAVAKIDGTYCYFDESGSKVDSPILFPKGKTLSGAKAFAVRTNTFDEKLGIIDSKGHIIVEPTYEFIGEFSQNGIAEVWVGGKNGAINIKGEITIEPSYDKIQILRNGAAIAQLYSNYFLLSREGEKLAEFKGWRAAESQGVFVKIGEKKAKWGYIDMKGNIVIEPVFDDILEEGFNDDLDMAAVKFGKFWGWIDRKGEWVIEPEFTKSQVNKPSTIKILNAIAKERYKNK